MNAQIIQQLMILIILGFYFFDVILNVLNLTAMTTVLPAEFADVYDSQKYAESQRYERTNTIFSMVHSGFWTMVIVLVIRFQILGILDRFVRSLSHSQIMQGLIFLGIIYTIYKIVDTFFEAYDTFVIEKKFGFSTTTVKIFVADWIKSYFLTLFIGGLIFAILNFIFIRTHNYFFILGLGVVVLIDLFFVLFYADLILPLFNKLSPLPDGELKQKIKDFAQKVGYELKDVYQIDSSKRSTKLNAFFTGLGSKKKVVLYDTLISKLTSKQIIAVLAHEIGHYKHKHILWQFVISVVSSGIFLYLLQFFGTNPVIARVLGASSPSFYLGLFALAILYTPVEFVIGIFVQILQRSFERQADKFAAQNYSAAELIEALKKISVENLSNLSPHPVYVFFHYSHPPLLERIRRLKDLS